MFSKCLVLLVFYTSFKYGDLQMLEEQRLIAYHRCQFDVHCQNISENSFCYGNDDNKTGYCKCNNGYELLSRNRTFFACLKYANYEEPCEKDIQCYYFLSTESVCDTTCKCSENSHRYTDGRCYKSILLGDYCQNDGNCWQKNDIFGNCVDGRCQCKYDKQLPTVDATSCVDAKSLGEACDNDDQCSFVPDAVCRVTCKCAPGFAFSLERKRCLKAATSFFESCEYDVQCSEYLQGSICNDGNCTCQDGHHGYGSRCTRNAGIGGTCTAIEECIPDPKFSHIANCTDGICQCFPGAVDDSIGCGSCRIFHDIRILSLAICILYVILNHK